MIKIFFEYYKSFVVCNTLCVLLQEWLMWLSRSNRTSRSSSRIYRWFRDYATREWDSDTGTLYVKYLYLLMSAC